MGTTWTGYPYPDPEHMLLCLGSGVNYKPVRAYRFYRIVIDEFDETGESLPYPYPNLCDDDDENIFTDNDGKNLMPVFPYIVLYMNPNNHEEFDPEEVAESMRCSYPQAYPYTWHVYQRQAIIVNQIDFDVYRSSNGLSTLPSYSISYPYRSPYRDLNPAFCANKEESLEQALKQLSITKSDIISNDLESRQCHYIWKRDKNDEGQESCAICLAEFQIREKIRLLGCEHAYHPSCIREWLKVKNECPICRFPAYYISRPWPWK